MATENVHSGYKYDTTAPTWPSSYLWPPVIEILRKELPHGGRIFEVGAGNGSTAEMLCAQGFQVEGIDSSESGIALAQSGAPLARLELGSAYDDLAAKYGTFPVVFSLEVVEHCFWPRKFAQTIFNLLQPGGVAVISTPYHGYLKNLMLAIFNKFDSHWSPMWDGGHIKFWSENTLRALLEEAGFSSVRFKRAGRIRPIAKSMIAIARKPPA